MRKVYYTTPAPSHIFCLFQATNWITNVIGRRLVCSMSSGEGSSFD